MIAQHPPASPRRLRATTAPLSSAQERLWFIDAAAPGSATYNVPLLARWREPVDVAALTSALVAVVRRHEVLRTTYELRDGKPVQVIADESEVDELVSRVVSVVDRSDWTGVREDAERLAREGFDLARRPPLRCVVWRGVEGGDAMLLNVHHIAVDGWSLAPLFEDLAAAYAAALAGEDPRLPELPIQYADFAVWDREVCADPAAAAQVAARVEELAAVPGDLALAGRTSRAPAVEGARPGGRHSLPLTGVWADVEACARKVRGTPFVVLFAAYQAVLQRWSGREEFLVGTVTANRPHSAVERLVGFFVNTVPLRCAPDPGETFTELCKRVRIEAFKSLSHQRIPFDRLLAATAAEDRAGMVTIGFALQNATPPELGGRPRWDEPELVPTGTAKFDLMLLVESGPDGPVCVVEHDTDRYPADVAARVAADFRALLAAAAADPDLPLRLLPVSGGRAGLPASALVGAKPTEDGATTVLDLIDRRMAAADPDAPAVSAGGTALSWSELDSWSWSVAGAVRGRGRFVPVLAARGGALVAGWLGALRAGATYAPLGLDTPVDRLRHVLDELGAEVVLVDAAGAAIVEGLGVSALRLEELAAAPAARPADPPRPGGDEPAVVIYTSGTTGRPKGVLVPHRGVLNTARWWAEDIALHPGDRLLCTWSTSFDGATHEVMRSLIAGSELVFADDVERRDPRALARLLGSATVTSMTPSLLRAVLDAAAPGAPVGLRALYVGGEALPPQLARECLARWGVPMRNIYGPTEASCISTYAPVDLAEGRSPAIGVPLPGTTAYVLGPRGEELPVGVPGELHVGGVGVALGYLGQPERTEAAFAPDPYAAEPGARMYRTGDLVALRPDGALDCLGRVDDQVKVLGNRVETGEVRKLLEERPAVRSAAVLAEGDPLRLVAWVALSDPGRVPTRDELLAPLLRWLPAAVLPTEVYVVDEVPLTGNDKTDFAALAGMRSTPLPRARRRASARTDAERAAAELFAAAVPGARAEELAPDAHFFTIGGHSLLAVTMLASAEQRRGGPVPLREFLADPTVRGLAALLSAPATTGVARPGVVEGDRFPATAVQQRFWFVDRVRELRAAYVAPCLVELTGPVRVDALVRAVGAVLGRHPALRSRFALDLKRRKVFYRTDGPAPRVEVVDASGWDPDRLADHLAEVCWTPFDLASDAPARAQVVLAGERVLLAVVAHHIVTDGWSQQVLMDQVGEVYQAEVDGRPARLAEPAHPAALPQPVAAPERVAAVVESLRGAPVDVELPHDRPRGAVQSTLAGTCAAALDADLAARLRAVAAESGCTTFLASAVLLAAALSRGSGQRDFLFAFPWAGREAPGSADAVGMFVNTLVLRVDLRGEPTWREALERVRAAGTACFRDADVPFDAVAAALHGDRDLSRPPVTPVYIGAATAPRPPALGAAKGMYLRPDPLHIKYEVEFTATEREGAIDLALSYAVDLFDAGTAADLLAALTRAAADLAADPDAPVAGTPIHEENPLHSSAPPDQAAAAASQDPADWVEPVRRAWAEVLDTAEVATDRNFFDVGGDSLLLIVLLERLNALTGRDLEAADLFRHSTVAAQSRLLAAPDGGAGPVELVALGATSRRSLLGRAAAVRGE